MEPAPLALEPYWLNRVRTACNGGTSRTRHDGDDSSQLLKAESGGLLSNAILPLFRLAGEPNLRRSLDAKRLHVGL